MTLTSSLRFTGVIYGIPLANNKKEGHYPVKDFLDVVKDLHQYEVHYDGYASHYRDQFEAMVYEKDGKLYGGIGTQDHNAEQYLTKRLLGRPKSWAGDTEPVKAPYQYHPKGWQISDHVNFDRNWLLMSKKTYNTPMADSIVGVMQRLNDVG